MCGRYALALPPWRVRQLLQDANMRTDDAPEDDDARQSYNFTPGYYGLVYRQDAPDHGAAGPSSQPNPQSQEQSSADDSNNHDYGRGDQSAQPIEPENGSSGKQQQDQSISHASSRQYKLQAMQWGLVPFWTKRRPDYANILRTINCRDDSLAKSGGMWQTMKQRKRCIVIAQGLFEWLKKTDGKDTLPHYIKRKDGQLMCFAGLWDCVKYEDKEDKNYTYTIITTDANKQISFLHDRMPVIFDNGSKDIFTWLDSTQADWGPELQSLLKPYQGELEIYPVTKDVNKAGNSSPEFIVPIDDAKQSISHFLTKKPASSPTSKTLSNHDQIDSQPQAAEIEHEEPDTSSHSPSRKVDDANCLNNVNEETNAPIFSNLSAKRTGDEATAKLQPPTKASKQAKNAQTLQPSKSTAPLSSKRSKSAISNATVSKQSPLKVDKKITSFFGK